jgi:hypothetical protein
MYRVAIYCQQRRRGLDLVICTSCWEQEDQFTFACYHRIIPEASKQSRLYDDKRFPVIFFFLQQEQLIQFQQGSVTENTFVLK